MLELKVVFGADDGLYLPVRPTGACRIVRGLRQRPNLLQGNLGNLSNAEPLLALLKDLNTHTHTHAQTHKHTAHALFIQRHGGWTPFTHREERQQKRDTGKKSSMQTRVSV